jgi:hypothetical protein
VGDIVFKKKLVRQVGDIASLVGVSAVSSAIQL